MKERRRRESRSRLETISQLIHENKKICETSEPHINCKWLTIIYSGYKIGRKDPYSQQLVTLLTLLLEENVIISQD